MVPTPSVCWCSRFYRKVSEMLQLLRVWKQVIVWSWTDVSCNPVNKRKENFPSVGSLWCRIPARSFFPFFCFRKLLADISCVRMCVRVWEPWSCCSPYIAVLAQFLGGAYLNEGVWWKAKMPASLGSLQVDIQDHFPLLSQHNGTGLGQRCLLSQGKGQRGFMQLLHCNFFPIYAYVWLQCSFSMLVLFLIKRLFYSWLWQVSHFVIWHTPIYFFPWGNFARDEKKGVHTYISLGLPDHAMERC